MAEAVIGVVLEHLLAMTTAKVVRMMDLQQELGNLESEFRAIKDLLQDAETMRISEQSVRSWLLKLKNVAFDLDDLLEELRITMGADAGTSHTNSIGFRDQVRNFFSNLKFLLRHPRYSYKYRAKVDEIKERLDQIKKEKNSYQFAHNPVRKLREVRITTPFIESIIIGRDEDREKLISKIIGEDLICGDNGEVPRISILGMGGLGKTTLARAIYNDRRVQNHFGGKCMWVCVGQVFDKEAILKTMIEKWGEKIVDERLSRPEQVGKMLEDRRYFLVLDDVWNEEYLEWEPLQAVLNKGAKDSRVLITTRNTGVEAIVKTDYSHELKGLSDNECLSIFTRIVFKEDEVEKHKYLMGIGESIVKKCGGLPLAVKTIAAVIRDREPTKEQWENILKSKMWDLSQSEMGILPVLMLSYAELTPQLKNCFGYCSIFKKDSILLKDQLIKMWVAQGFITVTDGGREEEEVGEECYHKLLARSMFQEPERGEDGGIFSCKMHDLVHDLAQLVTKEECRHIGPEDLNNNACFSLGNVRHCRVKEEVDWGRDTEVVGVEKLRTLIFAAWLSLNELNKITKMLSSVRVLFLPDIIDLNSRSLDRVSMHFGKLLHLRHLVLTCLIKELPASITKFRELLFLDLSDSKFRFLPENIVLLENLQTLDLRRCYNLEKLPHRIPASLRQLNVRDCISLKKLPETITSLGHLRVIDLTDCAELMKLPEGISSLPGLRRLSIEGCMRLGNSPFGTRKRVADNLVVLLDKFVVESSAGCSNIGDLGRSNTVCLRGELRIEKLEKARSREARAAKLEEKTSPRELSFQWFNDEEVHEMMAEAEGVLEGLHPPRQLSRIQISRYPAQGFPGWIGDGGVLGCLRKLDLIDCRYCTRLPCLGLLPCLENLRIVGLHGVNRVGNEFLGGSLAAFPSLISLEFANMENWSEWVTCTTSEDEEISELQSPTKPMPRLLVVIVHECPKLEGLPPFIFSHSEMQLELNIKRSPLLESLHFLPLNNTTIRGIHLAGFLFESEPIPVNWIKIVMNRWMPDFPSGLLRLTAMKSLRISGSFTIRHLPKELTQLRDLQHLCIEKCHLLSEGGKCKIGGKLWPIIAHIPCVVVDGINIQGDNHIEICPLLSEGGRCEIGGSSGP